ncbi:MAG: hypothetical protein M1286_02775 [Candidatus Marsarchaeota archaeon]|nr:hypothetical protein [Candidatus Marsarchaeota archaeon]
MQNIGKGLLLAAAGAIAWTFWSILSNVIVSLNTQTAILYLLFVEGFVTAITLVILVIYMAFKRMKLTDNDRKLAKYPVVAGICFGLGIIIYYGLIGNQNFPLVSSFQFGYIIVLALLISRVKHERLKMRYLLGTILVVAGLIAQTFALNPMGISASLSVILLSTAMLVLYAVGFYCSFYYAYGKMQLLIAVPAVLVTTLGVVLAYVIGFGLLQGSPLLTGNGIALAGIIALFVAFAYYAEEFGYRLLRRAKAKYINLANIIGNLELLGIIVYSVFFLSLSYSGLIVGLLLTLIGILLVAAS